MKNKKRKPKLLCLLKTMSGNLTENADLIDFDERLVLEKAEFFEGVFENLIEVHGVRLLAGAMARAAGETNAKKL